MGNIAKKCEHTQCVCESRVNQRNYISIDDRDDIDRMLIQTKTLVDHMRSKEPRTPATEQVSILLWLISDRLGEIINLLDT